MSANIGAKGRRRRLLTGLAVLVAAVAGLFALRAYGAPPWTRALLAFPLGFAFLGVFQAKEAT